LFATQKVRGISVVDRICKGLSGMESFHFGTGGKKVSPSTDSMQRTLGCIYHCALMGWVRELPSTLIIAFTFDSSCSVEGLQSITQHVWVSQVSQPALEETDFMCRFSFTLCILHWCRDLQGAEYRTSAVNGRTKT